MMQRAVNIKAKTGLRSNIIVQNFDIYYLKNYYLFNNTASKKQT